MKEKKYFEVMTFKVCLELRDDVPKDFAEKAVGGVYDLPDDNMVFRMWFNTSNGTPGLRIISHECWHLFMTIMNYIDKHEHTFEELNNEIYAYNFHKLFNDVIGNMFNMKMYQKALAEEEAEDD